MRATLWPRLKTHSTVQKLALSRCLRCLATAVAIVLISGCIYRVNIQQGNLLEEDVIDQVTIGMSRSAVQFLLGTPMIADTFHTQRWDYAYYLRQGRSRDIDRRWFVVEFEDDRVARLQRDLELQPATRR